MKDSWVAAWARPCAVLSNTGSLFRIYKLLTFTVYETVK